MAERTAVRSEPSRFSVLFTWSGLLNGDTGSWVALDEFNDRTVQLSGTPGAGFSLTMQGTNDTTATAFPLTDPQGNAITKTAVDVGETLLESPLYVRPNVTAGDGTTNAVVRLLCKRTMR